MRKLNKRILILCEGVTEELYAKALRTELPRALQRSVSIEISYSSKNDPKSLVNEAIRKSRQAKKERNPYDDIWLFFDNDNSPHLAEVFSTIEKENFSYAYSAMCIEHWFVLHFEDCGRAFQNGDEAQKHLKRLLPTYHKTKTNAYVELRQHLNIAINRAERIRKKQEEDGVHKHLRNPYFTVHDLIEFFNKLNVINN